MDEQITKKDFAKLFDVVSNNFKFKLGDGFEVIFNIIFEKIKDLSRNDIEKKIQQLLLISNEDWNKKYGYSGYPSLVDWLEILTGSKPLTNQEIEKRKTDYEQAMNNMARIIVIWLNDRNLNISFINRYKDNQNKAFKDMLDKFLNIKEELPDHRIIKMGEYLLSIYEKDKEDFLRKMRGVAKNQNQLILT